MAAESTSLRLSLAGIYQTVVISVPTALEGLLGRVDMQTCNDRLDRWCKRIIGGAGIDVQVTGRENLRGDETYLVMSNHQSVYDIPVMFYVLGGNLRMVAKAELFRIPVWGRAMRDAGFIAIDRSNRERARASLETARKSLAAGVHVWIAPEGTRSRTGKLLPFKKGGFALALDAGLPVLPVTIKGTRDALGADRVRSKRGAKVRVTIHPHIVPARYASQDPRGARDALMADVRRDIASGL